MERFLQTPFTDPIRSARIYNALYDAYVSFDRAAIQKAAQDAQQYVDEGGDFDEYFSDELWDFQGDNPEKLTNKYLLRLLRDRHCDDDEDKDYIRSGWHYTMSATYRQFNALKKKHPTAILLFRCGDFYEAYEDDAKKVSLTVGITLTRLSSGKNIGGIMTMFPHHALDIYLPKLVRAGYRIAICDQLEEQKLTKKLVKRGITETVKPAVPAKRKEAVQLSLFDF